MQAVLSMSVEYLSLLLKIRFDYLDMQVEEQQVLYSIQVTVLLMLYQFMKVNLVSRNA